jgi:hypothetical protein
VSELAVAKSTDSAGTTAVATGAPADFGFQGDFDDKFDFGGSASTSSFDDFDFSNKFKVNIPGSGTMTPVSEFDSADSEVAEEANLNWMGQSGVQTPSEPNIDFFGSDNFGSDANAGWANFGSSNTSIAEVAASPAKKKRAARASKKDDPSAASGDKTLKKQSSKKKVKAGPKDKKK